QGLRRAEELRPGPPGGDPVQGASASPPDGRAAGVPPGGGALPDRGGAHEGPVEPLHGAAPGVPGSAARSAGPGGPCGGAAGEPAAAGQAAEDLCRVRAVPHAGWETAPWYCATTLMPFRYVPFRPLSSPLV